MRIVFVIRRLDLGGAERQLLVLARGLRDRGHAVMVAPLYAGGRLETDFAAANVDVEALHKRHRWDALGSVARFIRLLRRERPDVLHGYLDAGNVLAASLRPALRRTAVVWGVRSSNMDLDRYDWFMRASFRATRLLSAVPDRIVVNSRAGRDHAIAHGFPASRIVVIANGVDTVAFRPDPDAGRAVRRDWGIGEAERVVGLVGRLDAMKDHETFLRAAAELSAPNGRPIRFVCVGEGPLSVARRLRTLAAELGIGARVLWAGARDDMPAVYNALDVLCSSSCGEGFPNVLAEALACGIPCVATDVGDSRWILDDDRRIAPARDPGALARLLGAALALPVDARERERLRRTITDRFGVERLVDATESLLASLVGGRR